MRALKLLTIATGAAGLAACASITNYDSWVQDDLQPTEHVAVFAPADSHSAARRLERLYCEELIKANTRVNCEPLTVQFPVGQDIGEEALQQALDLTEATHFVTINLLQSTTRTSTHGTIVGDFVWGHNIHRDDNLHQVQVLDLRTQQMAYSAQLTSTTELDTTQRTYLQYITRNIVKNQQERGLIAGI